MLKQIGQPRVNYSPERGTGTGALVDVSDAAKAAGDILELPGKTKEIQQEIQKHNLGESVTVDDSKVTVQIEGGESLTFAFSHTEGDTKFKDANAPYSRQQLKALVQVFGDKPAPYLEILGMKNTHENDGKTYRYNFYWSSSVRPDNNHAYGLFLSEDDVNVGYSVCDHNYSTLSVSN